MATFYKLALQPTGTTGDGLGILVAATSSTGTSIHTASTTTSTIDEVWLYAYNNHSSDILLTIEFGGTTAPKDVIKQTVISQAGLVLVVPGLVVQGNATAKVVRAFAATANQISIFGYVNRIS
jgi:hypothetical protein